MKKDNSLPVVPIAPDDPRLKVIKKVSKLMDEQFSIGGFKFGIDPLLNLIPVAGDIGSYVVSVALIYTMLQHGVSGKVAAKMLGNATFDALFGAIPVLGWVFDFTFKANTRNVKLLTEHYVQGKHKGSAKPVIMSFFITVIIIFVLIVFLSFKALQWLIHYSDSTSAIKF